MAALTEAQRSWLAELGVDLSVAARGPQPAAPMGAAAAAADAAMPPAFDPDAPRASTPPSKPYLDLNSPQMRDALAKGLAEQQKKDRQEAEQALARLDKQLAEARRHLEGLPGDQVARSSYAQIMADVRKRYPELAGLSQWVQETSRTVPELRGKLPSKRALMDVVESTMKARGAELGWSLSTGKNLATLASDRLLAAYMSELPAGVTVSIAGGVVQLGLEGAALAVATPAGAVDAQAGKDGAAVSLTQKDFTIQVRNEGWSEFDPELRGEWKRLEAETKALLTLRAERDRLKLELEQKKQDGTAIDAGLSADFDKREAEFALEWKKLQERITATAKASEQKIRASVAYLKKDKNDKDALKAGLEAEVDLKAMQGKLKAYAATPTLEAALELSAAADQVSAKLELKAVQGGAVVTAKFEHALDETKAAIEVLLREGKTTLAAELKSKADALSAKLKLVHETKDLKLAAELEKTLAEVRAGIELEVKRGRTTVKGGANLSSSGEAGGKVQIDIALRDGRTFASDGDKLSFAANVSTKGYKFEVAFSMGEPVDTASLQDLFATADQQIKALYRLAGDEGVRSIEDAKALNAKLQEVMAPVKAAADKAKTLKKKSEIVASFGFSLEGDWPAGGKVSPPAAMFGVKLMF